MKIWIGKKILSGNQSMNIIHYMIKLYNPSQIFCSF